MLNARVYRAGWIPVLFAVVLVAFSLREQPPPARSSLSAQGFDGEAAARTASRLATNPAFRARRPGQAGDDALAADVGRELRGAGFRVRYTRATRPTVDGKRELVSVLARRAGFSDRRILIVADRSAVGRSGPGSLSATAALLELGRNLGGRTLGRTLVLASTSGGPGGGGVTGVTKLAGGPLDAVLVLGDLGAGPDRRPWIVPWSERSRAAPLALRRTVEEALRTEARVDPGRDGFWTQLGRYAFPLTLGAQGPIVAAGAPAVLVASDGERGASGALGVDAGRLGLLGRGVLRAETALDTAGPIAGPARDVVLADHVVPEWAVRLLVAVLLLPVLLAVVDGLARVQRRRGRPGMWLAWTLAGVLPFVLCVLIARALGALGAVPATPVALGAGVTPLDRGAAAALVLLAAVLGVGWLALRPLTLRLLGVRGDAASPGATAAALAVALVATVVLWLRNPFAAGLVVPALHLWLLACAPETRPRRRPAVLLVALGALPPLLVALGYAVTFGLGPLDVVWTGVLALAGGAVPLAAAVAWSAVLGVFASMLLIAARPRTAEAAGPVSVRGPHTYAGPGSLGGTNSALRR